MILLIDNYDSFSYNLYQLIGEINSDIKVIRNDEMTIEEIKKLNPTHIVLSPGPGRPKDSGICIEIVQELKGSIPILGVCLGHQAICEAFGATVSYAKKIMHGKSCEVELKKANIFQDLPKRITVARYHSLAVIEETLPKEIKILVKADDQEIMAVKHEKYPIYGLQFHPESILTPKGKKIVENFLGGKNND